MSRSEKDSKRDKRLMQRDPGGGLEGVSRLRAGNLPIRPKQQKPPHILNIYYI